MFIDKKDRYTESSKRHHIKWLGFDVIEPKNEKLFETNMKEERIVYVVKTSLAKKEKDGHSEFWVE